MDLQEVEGDGGDWMELALVGTVRNLRVPKMRRISWIAAGPVSFSRRTLLHGVSKLVCHNKISSIHSSKCSKMIKFI